MSAPRLALASGAMLACACAAAPPAPAPVNQPAPPVLGELGPGCFRISRGDLEAASSDWAALARSTEVRWLADARAPGVKHSEAWPGVAVSNIRPGALAARLGLRDGDVVFALDGYALPWFEVFATALADPELAAEASQLGPVSRVFPPFGREIDAASLSVVRSGSVITLNVLAEDAPVSACDAHPRLRERDAEEWLAERRCTNRDAAAMAACYEQLEAPRRAAPDASAPAEDAELRAAGVATSSEADGVIASISKLDAVTVELPRALTSTQLLRVLARERGARIVPAVKNGQRDGVKLYAIRPGSILAALGLQNGDTLHQIAGAPVHDRVLPQLSKLADHAGTTIELTRRGAALTLSYRH